MLFYVLCIVTVVLASLLYLRYRELNDLHKYVAKLESDLLQKHSQSEEITQSDKDIPAFAFPKTVDPVTGLPSLHVFEDRAQQTFFQGKRFGKPFGIILLDIQGFSLINKELGFEKANLLLNEISKKLDASTRKIDTVSRYRDDVFIILLPQLTQPETAAYVAQRLLAELQEPFYIDEKLITIKASLGIAICPDDGDNLNILLERANSALQQAKSSHESQYYFYSADLQKIGQRELQMSGCLNSENLTENLVCYCLPQVNVITNHIVGVKLTAYINDPILGLLTQDDYQGIAERENKMIVIVEWLIKQAVVHFTEWQRQGLKPDRVVISVSARQIQHEDFVESVAKVLAKTAFDPTLIAFEVSAESFANSIVTLQGSFLRLKHIGVQLAVGVFDLGDLAMQKITQLPITYLKLDQAILKNMSSHPENEIILATLKNLSKNMGLFMVVEGVDDEKQKIMLRNLGFEIMQGKCFGEPQEIQFFMR